MSHHQKKMREKALNDLTRISITEIENLDKLVHVTEDLALELGNMVESAKSRHDPYWWRYQDMLDDVLSILEYVKSK